MASDDGCSSGLLGDSRPVTPPITPEVVGALVREVQDLRRTVSTKSTDTCVPVLRQGTPLFTNDRVLPDFDPSSSNQTLDEWLRKGKWVCSFVQLG